MNRRRYLAALGAAGAGALAGCLGFETRSVGTPAVLEDRPDAVYVPTHVEGMEMVGTARAGDYAFALTYSYPHRFWTVTGTEVSKTGIEDDDDLHLMAMVWDPETGTVLPDTGLSLELVQDGDLVKQEVIYPMLSQPMGFHYGGNFATNGEGEYTARVSVGAVTTRRTGAFRDRFDAPASAEFALTYSESKLNGIPYRNLPDRQGTTGAVKPREMEAIPSSKAPAKGDLPGTVRGETTSGDAVFVVATQAEAPAGVDADGPYLAVSARTPYNRMVVPMMALTATLERGGETVYDGALARTLDPDLGYHYGAAVPSAESGDRLALEVTTPPQVARHEGYETAFLDMAPMELTL